MSNPEISPVKYALNRLKKHRLRLASAIMWSILFVIIPMQVPVLTGALIDGLHGNDHRVYGFIDLSGKSPETSVNVVVIGLIVVAVSYGFVAYLRNTSRAKISRHFVFDLQKQLIQKLEFLSLDAHSKYGSGELINRTIVDVNAVRPFVEGTIIKTTTNVVRIAYPLAMLFLVDPLLAALGSSILPVQLLVTRKLQQKLKESSKHSRRNRALLTTSIKENLDGLESVQTLGAETYMIDKISEQIENAEEDQIRTQKYYGLLTGFAWGLTSLGLAITWWQGGMQVIAGQMTVGTLVAVTGLVVFIYAPIRRFTEVMKDYDRSINAVEHIQEILDYQTSVREAEGAKELKVTNGEVIFRAVSFSYGNRKVIDSLHLVFKPKCITALIGKNGSGKSSILRLISRLYDPVQGEVLIDGQNIAQVTIISLRKHIAVVPQDPIIFSTTVLENLKMAKPDATEDEVRMACEMANALEFIERLPKGFSTKLGAGGVTLSGGQAQRVAIARALLRRPKILLLDEPSSAQDSRSEQAIMETLQRLKADMTIILVAHHLQTTNKADNLVVLEDGMVIGQGKHEELMITSKPYKMLYSESGQ